MAVGGEEEVGSDGSWDLLFTSCDLLFGLDGGESGWVLGKYEVARAQYERRKVQRTKYEVQSQK